MAYSYTRRHIKALAEASNSAANDGDSSQHVSSNHCEDWNPNQIVYNKVSVIKDPRWSRLTTVNLFLQMEQIIEKMQDEQAGVPVRTVKSFMSKIPSVFTGLYQVCYWLR